MDLPESVWVAMGIGHSRNGYPKEALFLYYEMVSRFGQLDNFTFSMALKACSDLGDLRTGRAVHAQVLKATEDPDQVVNNALVRLYSEDGCFEEAIRVFDEMPQRNVYLGTR